MILNKLFDFFFPKLCVICQNRLVEGEYFICVACLAQLPKTNYHLQAENRHELAFAARFPFERIAAYAYFVKGGSMQKIIHELKYKHNPRIGWYMGQLYGEDLKGSEFISTIDYIVPVPLHTKRERKRGYNQSYEIAKGIADKTGVPIENKNLMRCVNNPSQTKNSREERWKNVESIFTISDKYQFQNKHILLLDDVITTGSTIEACVKELLQCDGIKITVVGLAVAR